MNDLVIYTDGAYSPIRDSGGIGIVILKNGKKIFAYSNKYEHTSNNQMEIGAIVVALRLIKDSFDSITIYSDSQYCIGCITSDWQRKKNIRLWDEFDKQYERVKKLCSNIKFIHVKGHQTGTDEHTKWNNYVDELARKASCLI